MRLPQGDWHRQSGAARLRRVLIGLVLFGAAFGYVEAAVVVYLRALVEPVRERVLPGAASDELFPIVRFDQLRAEGPAHVRRLGTEVGRELATLVMLAGAGLTAARSFREWLAAFLVAFGVWDIFYYVFLRLLLGWPASLLTWDLLFLIPVPWTGPVLAPVLVSISMIGAGAVVLWRESAGRPVALRWPHWTAIVAGGVLIVVAFCWDYRNIAAGGQPNPFHWPLFAAGGVVGLGVFLQALLAHVPRLQTTASGDGSGP